MLVWSRCPTGCRAAAGQGGGGGGQPAGPRRVCGCVSWAGWAALAAYLPDARGHRGGGSRKHLALTSATKPCAELVCWHRRWPVPSWYAGTDGGRAHADSSPAAASLRLACG